MKKRMKNKVTVWVRMVLPFCLLTFLPFHAIAQMTQSIKLNEVMTNNTASLQDEYGTHEAWIEIANISYSTYNIRGMYLTTDTATLRPMSAPERMKLMSIIPNGDERTQLNARQHVVFFCNSTPNHGTLHLTVRIAPEKPTWIGLFNGNATELIDSVTVPVLGENQSYARKSDGSAQWQVKPVDAVTPGIENFIKGDESKIDKFKREDPHGFGMTLMAMGIVFFCLATLWLFFTIFGAIMKHQEAAKKVAHQQPMKPITKTVEKTMEVGHKTGVILQEGLKTKGIDKEVYMAVIGLALRQYEDDIHDVESGVITIRPKDTGWDDEYSQMTQMHEAFIPTNHNAPTIPTNPEVK